MLGTIITAVLSSTLFTIVMSNRSEKLRYVTAERAVWRREIKDISSRIDNSDSYDKEAHMAIRDLKNRINAYGRAKSGEYPEDTKLRIFKDEHIWKEIDKIENETNDYCIHKKKLLEYIECLLKFEWEKTKKEATPNYLIILSVLIYYIPLLIYVLLCWGNKSGIVVGEISYMLYLSTASIVMLYLPLIFQSLDRQMKFTFTELLQCWVVGGILMLYYLCAICKHCDAYKFENTIFILDGIIVFIIVMVVEAQSHRFGQEYENAVISILGCAKIMYIYTNRYLKFPKYDAYFADVNARRENINANEERELFAKLVNILPDDEKSLRYYLKKRKRPPFWFKRKNDKIKEYILQKPYRCRSFVIYNGKSYVRKKDIKKEMKNI